MSLTNQPQLECPVEKRPLRELRELAAMLGGQRPDGMGGMIPVDEAERARILNELQRTDSAAFTLDDERQLRWHRRQGEAAESAMEWDAAVFHWERALDVKAENGISGISMESRRTYADQAAAAVRQAVLHGRSRWSVILHRPSWATPELLDLGSFYTVPLGEPLVARQPGTSFRRLAAGVQVLGGTGFDVRGIIHLKLTNSVTIPVGRVCRRLHFLQAASRAAWSREIAATYYVTYAGGVTESVTLRNPEDVPPYTSSRFHEVWAPARAKAEAGLQSEPAWAGYATGPTGQKELLHLAHTTWTLPETHHGKVLESIELRAGPAPSAPLVFAITAE